MNPELRRNAWLELGPQRLLAMPIVLGLVFALVYLLADNVAAGWAAVTFTAALLYGLATVLWGTHMAGDAVLGEVAARTWDWQRMSSIGPWTMTWGKLVGSTLYAWYAALICLPVFIFASLARDEIDTAWWVGMLLSGAVLAHAVGLTWSLLLVHNSRDGDPASPRRSSAYLLVLLVLVGVVPWLSGPLQDVTPQWYGSVETGKGFALASLAVFAAWAVVGAYRLMRVELQFRDAPWAWLAFSGFLMGYIAGFIDPGGRLLAGYVIGLLLTAVVAFTTPRDPLQLRRLGQALRAGDVPGASRQTPPWLVSVVLVALLGAAVVFLPGNVCRGPYCPEGFASDLAVVLMFLFLLRDLGILWLVSLGGRSRRPELATVVYLIVLYSIVPGLLGTLGADDWTALFLPRADLSPAWAVSAALPGPLLVGVLLWRRAGRGRAARERPAPTPGRRPGP